MWDKVFLGKQQGLGLGGGRFLLPSAPVTTLSYTRFYTEERLQSYVYLFDTNTFEPLASK